jgi:hypothetical protein
MIRRHKITRRSPKQILLLAVGVMVASVFVLSSTTSYAAIMGSRRFLLLNSRAGVTTNYTVNLTATTTGTLGSVQVMVCSNSPLEVEGCVAPSGFNMSAAVLSSQTGPGNFSILSATANTMIFSRPPSAVTAPLPISFQLTNVVNPSTAGSYYGRILTYASADSTGSRIDFGGLAFAATLNLSVTTYVPPYLAFCSALVITGLDCTQTSGDYINLGELSSTSTRAGQSQLLVATNATDGYNIQATGSTLESGNNVIRASNAPTLSQFGVAQFGINLRANFQPNIGADPIGPGVGLPVTAYDTPNRFVFVNNDIIVQSLLADDYRKYTVSYIVNISPSQAPGVYVSTITYVCTGNF